MGTSSDVTTASVPAVRASVGVIGGSGFYSFFDGDTARSVEVTVPTPYGDPSDAITIGIVSGRQVAFLPRHGRHHSIPPHRVNYRANAWAMRSLGVRQIFGPCAVGSLRPEVGPATLVIPDQLVDRTHGRAQTFYDGSPDPVVHVAFADPYCPRGRAAALAAARTGGFETVDGGTLVVVDGPRFGTRAESQWHAAAGWTVVGMTGHPEAILARELAVCYTSIALVTDHDAGIEGGEAVTHEAVLATFAASVGRLRSVVSDAIARLPHDSDGADEADGANECRLCARALDGFDVSLPD